MIRIDRGPEPAELTAERFKRLSAAELARQQTGALPDADVFGGYGVAREPLFRAQHAKCAYCERPTGLKEQPTEHFRPKNGARRDLPSLRGNAPRVPDCYWWLAWTWENLLFSCATCNGQSHKGNFFPIDSPALATMSFDLHCETALLVDPTVDDPLDHIRWEPLKPLYPRDQWEWYPVPVPLSDKGRETIEVFHFDKFDLQGSVSHFIQAELVKKRIPAIEATLGRGDVTAAVQQWQDMQEETMHERALFTGAKWSALVFLQQQPGSLLSVLPEPPRPGRHTSSRPPIIGLPPTPSGIPNQTWLRLLANEEIDEALVDLLATPRDLASLRALLCSPHSNYQPAESTLRGRLRGLVKAGTVRRNTDGTYIAM